MKTNFSVVGRSVEKFREHEKECHLEKTKVSHVKGNSKGKKKASASINISTSLDTKTSDEVLDLLLKLNKERGVTMVLVTHDADVASRCSRILVMRDGRITEDRRSGEEE